ncbi:hypothetical protein P7H21_09350 [Paenibacillus larvae]|nr:hypothetical protein [Paenibacillus larvae]MDT2304131.1 hypothetical protein [Paenibacillus larvae]
MDSRIALRVELENAISEAGCTLSKLQQIGGSHIGNLSDILRREGRLRPITMKQLDTLTETLDLPEGHYYDLYLAECFFNNRLAVPRMKSFLIRCSELGKTDLVMKAIHILVEHPEYIELLFSVAEELYLNGLVEEFFFMRKSLRRKSIMNRIGYQSLSNFQGEYRS